MNTNNLRLISLLGFLFLIGCSSFSSPNVWWKPSWTDTEWKQDKYVCLLQSQQGASFGYIAPNSLLGGYQGFSSSEVKTNLTLFNACMESKGWELINEKVLNEKLCQSYIACLTVTDRNQREICDNLKNDFASLSCKPGSDYQPANYESYTNSSFDIERKKCDSIKDNNLYLDCMRKLRTGSDLYKLPNNKSNIELSNQQLKINKSEQSSLKQSPEMLRFNKAGDFCTKSGFRFGTKDFDDCRNNYK